MDKKYVNLLKKYAKCVNFNNVLQENENIEILYQDEKIRIEKIVSCGYFSPENFWYDQSEKEYIYIALGEGGLEFEKEKITLKKGDFYYIEPHKKHRVYYTSTNPPCIWICLFCSE